MDKAQIFFKAVYAVHQVNMCACIYNLCKPLCLLLSTKETKPNIGLDKLYSCMLNIFSNSRILTDRLDGETVHLQLI